LYYAGTEDSEINASVSRHQGVGGLLNLSANLQEKQLQLLHPFNGLFSRTTWVSQYQKGKTSLDWDDAVLGRLASAGPYPNNLHIATEGLQS